MAKTMFHHLQVLTGNVTGVNRPVDPHPTLLWDPQRSLRLFTGQGEAQEDVRPGQDPGANQKVSQAVFPLSCNRCPQALVGITETEDFVCFIAISPVPE